MSWSLPGFEEIEEGRGFIYIEVPEGEEFRVLVDRAYESRPADRPLPADGGVGEEKVRVRLPDGTWLLGLSYTRDLPGWKGLLVSFCEQMGKRYAFPRKSGITLF